VLFSLSAPSAIHTSVSSVQLNEVNRPIIQFCRLLVGKVAQNKRNVTFFKKISDILFVFSASYIFLSYHVLGKGY